MELDAATEHTGLSPRPSSFEFANKVYLALVIVGAMATLLSVLVKTNHGFDFSDEGYYVNWIAAPRFYQASSSQFGFFYHYFYTVFGRDIVDARIFNVILTYGLAVVAVQTYVSGAFSELRLEKLSLFAFSLAFGGLSLAAFSTWLVTPNYNTLAFQGLLIATIGMNLAAQFKQERVLVPALLLGLGGCLTFLAKPTAAGWLAIGVVCTLAALRALSLRLAIAAAGSATLFLMVSSFVIDDGPAGFVRRLHDGLELQMATQAGYGWMSMFRLDRFRLSIHEKIFMGAWVVVTALGILSSAKLTERPRRIWIGCNVLFLATIAALICAPRVLPIADPQHLGMQAFAALYASLVVLGIVRCRTGNTIDLPRCMPLIPFFLLMPYFFSFGTNRNYWEQSSYVCLFWALPAVGLLRPMATMARNFRFLIPLALGIEVLTLVILHRGYEYPYRQPVPLHLQTTETRIGGVVLKLSSDAAAYIRKAQAIAAASGFQANTPILDLSGQSPGLIYALGGTGLGYPWLAGAYPGSNDVARATIIQDGCVRASQAWVLTEDGGTRELTKSLVALYGANLGTDYVEIGSWWTAGGVSGRRENKLQRFFKPLHSEEVAERCHRVMPASNR